MLASNAHLAFTSRKGRLTGISAAAIRGDGDVNNHTFLARADHLGRRARRHIEGRGKTGGKNSVPQSEVVMDKTPGSHIKTLAISSSNSRI
jgi:hypothetical protein